MPDTGYLEQDTHLRTARGADLIFDQPESIKISGELLRGGD